MSDIRTPPQGKHVKIGDVVGQRTVIAFDDQPAKPVRAGVRICP